MLVVLLLTFTALSTPTHLYVGQLFKEPVFNGIHANCLPGWLRKYGELSYGIPEEKDIGNHTFFEREADNLPTETMLIEVREEETAPCSPNRTFWLEAHFNKTPTFANKLDSLLMISNAIKMDIRKMRVYSIEDSRKNRILEDIGQYERYGQYLVMWPITCGDSEAATTIMDAFIDMNIKYHSVFLAEGHFRSSSSKNAAYKHICMKKYEPSIFERFLKNWYISPYPY